MALSSDIMRRLSELSLDPPTMRSVLSIIADVQAGEEGRIAVLEKRKRADRERKAMSRSMEIPRTVHGNSADSPWKELGNSADMSADISPDKEKSPTPSKEINPLSSLRSDSPSLVAPAKLFDPKDFLADGQTMPALPKPKAPPRRATRLPDDFQPDLGDALAVGLTREEGEEEARIFRDHWISTSKNPAKHDWPATWRNWCRRAAKNPRKGTNDGKSSASVKPRSHDAIFGALARAAEKRAVHGEREAVLGEGRHGDKRTIDGDFVRVGDSSPPHDSSLGPGNNR